MSSEICIVVDIWIVSMKVEMKADSLNLLEGSSPECVRASVQDTTGV